MTIPRRSRRNIAAVPKTEPLRPGRRPNKGSRCFRCEGMPWRRDRAGCTGCGEPYADNEGELAQIRDAVRRACA